MLPLRLELRNFLAYRATTVVPLDGLRLACLVGVNGAGKSSLLDAITWALWGEARAKGDDLIHQGQVDMYVQLDFLHEGVTYRILRKRTRARNLATAELYMLADDGTLSKLSSGVRETEAKVVALLRMDYTTFVNSAFLKQGEADMFTRQSPDKRKQILADILGLERWEAYARQAKLRRDAAATQVELMAGQLRAIDDELLGEPAAEEALRAAQRAHSAEDQALHVAEVALNELADARPALEAAEAERSAMARRRDGLLRDQADVARSQEEVAARLAQYESVVAGRAEVEAGYQALREARTADSTLTDKLRQVKTVDDQRAVLLRAIDAARATLRARADALASQGGALRAQAASVDAGALEATEAEAEALAAKQGTADALAAEVEQLRAEHATLDADNRALRDTMNALRERITRLEATGDALCPLCGQPLSVDHRATLLADLQAEGTRQGDTWRGNDARKRDMDALLKERTGAVRALQSDLRRLADVQALLGRLRAEQTAARNAAVQHKQVEDELAVVQAQLDADDFAHDPRVSLAALDADRAALGYDPDQHKDASARLGQLQAYEQRWNTLSVADEMLPMLAQQQEGHTRRATLLREELAALDAQIAEHSLTLERLQARHAAYEEQRRRTVQLRTTVQHLWGRVQTAEQTLDALKAQRHKRARLVAQQTLLAEQRDDYDTLLAAFGRRGVPALIIENVLPELDMLTNDLLGRLTNGRMTVRLRAHKPTKSGTTQETLELEIGDELGTRPYENYSGGETFRVNFALRVAMSKLLARRAGAHLQTLFIDEGFGTLDADGRDKLIEAIAAVQEDFAMILVITHIEELQEAFPVRLEIRKTNEGSRVAVV